MPYVTKFHYMSSFASKKPIGKFPVLLNFMACQHLCQKPDKTSLGLFGTNTACMPQWWLCTWVMIRIINDMMEAVMSYSIRSQGEAFN